MNELKACPIYGSRVKIHKNIAHAGQYGIVCMTCPLEMLHFPTRVELIEAWNTRPNDAKNCYWIEQSDIEMDGTYETSCKEMWAFTEDGIKENNVKFCPFCGGKITELRESPVEN